MAIVRHHLHDTGWSGRRATIEHDTVTHEVTIDIFGPQGGKHGTMRVPEQEAVEAFRAIIGSVMGIAERRQELLEKYAPPQRTPGPLGTTYPGHAVPDADVT